MMRLATIFFSVLLITACGSSGGDGGADSGTDSGTAPNSGSGFRSGFTAGLITLAGPDTATVGTEFAGFAGSMFAVDERPDTLLVVDENSTVIANGNFMAPVPADTGDVFVLTVLNDLDGEPLASISLLITVNGTEFGYACLTLADPDGCGGSDVFSLDVANKTVIFTDAKVVNTDTGAEHTLNGTLTW